MALRAGFIGLGDMGRPMAERWVAAGIETTVYDLAEAPVRALVEQGAKAAASPREAAAGSQVVGVCVPSDDDVRAVCLGEDGLFEGGARGMLVAVHSTVLPNTVIELADAGSERGVVVFDACVTGGAQRARDKQLTFLVGGDPKHVETARPAFGACAEKIIHCGALGNGCKTKLCINLITYLQWAAAFESLTLARAVGLPVEVLEEAGLSNGQLTPLMVRFLAGHKLPDEVRKSEGVQKTLRGHMHVAEKDLAWSLQLAREAGVALPAAGLVSQLMARLYGVEDPGRR
jgi:3-hydroxyisobutyrate dehydrogenase-like beta-hydroxyacid dehydrogenase